MIHLMYNRSGVLHEEEVTNDRRNNLAGGISQRTLVRFQPLQQVALEVHHGQQFGIVTETGWRGGGVKSFTIGK
jgi:hypothetical protein